MNVRENKLIINDYLNADYEIANAFLLKSMNIDTLEINNSEVNLDTIKYFISGTNIKSIILNDSVIYYETNDLININSLVINNIVCDNYEMFVKFRNLSKLIVSNLPNEFNCYYLRVLNQLNELGLINVRASHLGGLGYVRDLNILHLNNIPIKNWVFTTKIFNLKTLYLSSEYDFNGIPRLLFSIKDEKEI